MKVAINGFGRIGRLVFKILMEDTDTTVVAINDLTSPKELAHLLKYDTVHGNYMINDITNDSDSIKVKDKKIKVFNKKDPLELPWSSLDIDIVFECTGKFTELMEAKKHILAGAKNVIISAPGKGDMKTIVYGVNEKTLDGSEDVISAASCTTNALAPILKILEDNIGIKKGFMTTIHAYTNDQIILDISHKKGIESRRGRAAAQNIIPTSTGAATSIGKVIPSLEGKIEGASMRVPVADGSMLDLTMELNKNMTIEEINTLFKNNISDTINITFDPIVSSDIIGNSHATIVDGLLTNVLKTDAGTLTKIVSWYDNEYGYSMQMVKTAKYFYQNKK